MTDTTTSTDGLIRADVAAAIACCSARTLSRKAAAGEITAHHRPGYKVAFYRRREIERLRPKEKRS